MRLELIAAAQLSDAERDALEALHAAVYPPKRRAVAAPATKKWARPQWHFLIHDEDHQLMSHVGAVSRTCLCDSTEIVIGGIGGVMTHPAQRGKGYAGAGIQRATKFLRDELQVDMSLLFCAPRMRQYYRRFGFSAFAGDTHVRQDGVKIRMPRNEVMVIAANKPLPSHAQLDLLGLPW